MSVAARTHEAGGPDVCMSRPAFHWTAPLAKHEETPCCCHVSAEELMDGGLAGGESNDATTNSGVTSLSRLNGQAG